MLLVIDNYDSFTYNLVQYFRALGQPVITYYNNQLSLKRLATLKPRAIIISPGPGAPKNAGISKTVIKKYAGIIPILGVCLGQQCIGEVFGAKIIQAQQPIHGETARIYHDKHSLFKKLPNPFVATRYHSLIIDPTTLPTCLEVSAWTKSHEIMGIRLKQSKAVVAGVQFHPESILTTHGKQLLLNF